LSTDANERHDPSDTTHICASCKLDASAHTLRVFADAMDRHMEIDGLLLSVVAPEILRSAADLMEQVSEELQE